MAFERHLSSLWMLLSVFLFTLGSYYFYSLGVYLLQLVGLLLLIPFCRTQPLLENRGKLLLLFVFFFYVYAVNGIYVISGINNFAAAKIFFPALVLLCLLFASGIASRRERFQGALGICIIVHCAAFLFQFVIYLVSKQFIDFLAPITGEEQRAFGGSYELSYLPHFIRATGLYNEPGTYATYTILLFALYKDLGPKSAEIGTKGDWLLELLVVATLLLSFSTFGYVFLALYALIVYVFSRTTKLRLAICAGLIVLAWQLFFEYFQQRFLHADGGSGVEYRVAGLASYFHDLQWWTFLFGRGFSADLVIANGEVLILQDIGFWFGLVYYFGLIGTLIFGVFLLTCLRSFLTDGYRGPYFLLLILCLLLSKLVLTSVLTLALLFYVAIRSSVSRQQGRAWGSKFKNDFASDRGSRKASLQARESLIK